MDLNKTADVDYGFFTEAEFDQMIRKSVQAEEPVISAALKAFLVAVSEHSAAMYDLGFAIGSRNPSGKAERALEEVTAIFVQTKEALEKVINDAR